MHETIGVGTRVLSWNGFSLLSPGPILRPFVIIRSIFQGISVAGALNGLATLPTMATVLRSSRPQDSRSSTEKDELSLDLKTASVTTLEVSEPPRRRWWQPFRTNSGLDGIATQPSVFDDPSTLDIYRPPTSYENTHRFDPSARWTWREEFVSAPGLRSTRVSDGPLSAGRSEDRLESLPLGIYHVLRSRPRPNQHLTSQHRQLPQ